MQRGEVLTLGRHRLMCGDATSLADVMELFGEDDPLLLLADPPEGGGLHMMQKGSEWASAFSFATSGMKAAYVWHSDQYADLTQKQLRALGFKSFQHLTWDQGKRTPSRFRYHYQHEPCWYARKPKAPWYGGRGSTVITCDPGPQLIREGRSIHPTNKPEVLYSEQIVHNLKEGEWLYDPCAGSGTSLIVAEKLGVNCLAMELEPKYCDVIVARYEALNA